MSYDLFEANEGKNTSDTDCPGLKWDLPDSLLQQSISFSLWASKEMEITELDENNKSKTVKKQFSPFTKKQTVGEVLERLRVMVVGLKWHIYTAHRQWTGHDVHRTNLNSESIITIEDYQMNMEVDYRENLTSLAYSTNKKTVGHGSPCPGSFFGRIKKCENRNSV